MSEKERLTTTTYLSPEEKEWLRDRAQYNSRSIAGELRQLVIEKMREEGK